MPNYRRAWAAGGTFFFTTALADRRSSLLTNNIALLRKAFTVARQARPFRIDAIVVLPDHLHCIWTLPHDDKDFATRWAHVKSAFSRALPQTHRRNGSQILRREKGIWQRRYWEHLIRDEADFRSHIDYVHFNPVKHGHARCVADWPWSSFHRYVRTGVLTSSWGGTGVDGAGDASEPVG